MFMWRISFLGHQVDLFTGTFLNCGNTYWDSLSRQRAVLLLRVLGSVMG